MWKEARHSDYEKVVLDVQVMVSDPDAFAQVRSVASLIQARSAFRVVTLFYKATYRIGDGLGLV